MKVLIVNADDFGFCPAVNRGVIRAHVEGIVSSASLMVRWPDAAAAARAAARHPTLSVGLHVDLGEWVHGDDGWSPQYLVVSTDDERAVRSEVERQVEAFRALAGSYPTHLDSHQHVHRQEPVATVVATIGRELGVPVRDVTEHIQYRGDFYGQSGKGWPYPQAITAAALVGVLQSLPDGVTELGCHPADGEVPSVYGRERSIELATLCDPYVRAALLMHSVQLISFREVDRARL